MIDQQTKWLLPVGRHYFNVLYNVSYLITNQFYFGTEEKHHRFSPRLAPTSPAATPGSPERDDCGQAADPALWWNRYDRPSHLV